MSNTQTTATMINMKSIIKALRPNQWTKNAVVLAAFFFALGDPKQSIPLSSAPFVLLATAIFCMISSGVYILNDIKDISEDRKHPLKCFRPIAAGEISISTAYTVAVILLITGVVGAFALSHLFAAVIVFYILLQIAYSVILKRIALVDIMVIASGFVLRALAGAIVVNVEISPWLLLCAFLLALFLALCKRRHEKMLFPSEPKEHRASLQQYDTLLLDQLIGITSAATIVSYSMYTLSPTTITKFDTKLLGLTIPFVVFGIFRYLDLVYRKNQGDRPEKILLSDTPLIIDIALYGITVVAVFLLK